MTKQDYICLTCNTQFKPKNKSKANKFCGLPCYRVYQKTPAYKIAFAKVRTKHIYFCANCDSEVKRHPSTKRNGEKADKVYCNRKCYNEHRVKW